MGWNRRNSFFLASRGINFPNKAEIRKIGFLAGTRRVCVESSGTDKCEVCETIEFGLLSDLTQ